MFDYLKGTLVKKLPTHIVVEVMGVGYSLTIPLSSYDTLPDENEEVKLYTHFQVTDDSHRIFGFTDEKQRNFFRLLISVNKVGPVLGITIMSGASIDEISNALVAENVEFLKRLKGIGTKTAERLVIELREAAKDYISDKSTLKPIDNVIFKDAVLALISLGFNRNTASKAVNKAISSSEEGTRLEIIIKRSLSYV